MKIINCQVNHLENPLGYQLQQPTFSYQVVESVGKKQIEARIIIFADEKLEKMILDTGWSEEIDNLAHTIIIPLKPCTRYYWTVSVRSDIGEEATSELHWFETGKQEQAWKAKWITCREKDGRHPIFYKKGHLEKTIAKARLYICGLGLYEASINQKKVGDEFLTPYCNDYNEWIQYQTYDVSHLLTDEFELEVELGNGWYKGRFGFDQLNRVNHYGDSWELIAELQIEYADGTTQTIITDEDWNVRYGTILESSIYDGEIVDMTLPSSKVESVLLSDRSTDKLTARLSTQVVIHEELKPQALIKTPNGELVLDMGQNHAGIFKLKVNEPKGTKIRLQFGEILQDGNFYRDNLRTAKAEYVYISNGKERVIQPKFTFYGYRYVKIEGVTHLDMNDFTSCVLYSIIPKIGKIESGNEKVNKLLKNVEWGLKSNFIDVPTDCPQRDERLGWTGDAQVFSKTACYLRDCYSFYRKYLHDLSKEQEENGGRVPNYIPSFGDEGTSSVWGDAASIIPWNLYLFTGDKMILKDQFASMCAWIEYIKKIDGEENGWDKVFHFGDWLALDRKSDIKNEVMGATDIDYIARVYYLNSVKITEKVADILGEKQAAEKYHQLAKKLADYLRAEFFSINGRGIVQTQTGLLMALEFGLLDNNEKIIDQLQQKLEENNHKLDTGFIGTSMICNVLTEHGMVDIAYELLLNEGYPGWLYAVNLGATTVWERWNSVQEDGSLSSSGMNSLNHYSYGSIVEWIFKHCAGIQPILTEPGFRKAYIAPNLNWKLRSIKSSYQSSAGEYRSEWELINSNHVNMTIEVPFGCEAIVTLPNVDLKEIVDKENPIFERVENGNCVLNAGIYHVSYKTNCEFEKIISTSMPIKEVLYNSSAEKFLLEHYPSIFDIPHEMRSLSMREVAAQYSNGDESVKASINEQFDQLDALLKLF